MGKPKTLIYLTMFLLAFGIQETFAQRAIIAFNGVELYALPMVDNTPVVVLSRGDTVRVIGQRGDWVKVEFRKGKKGWMQVQVPQGKEGRVRSKSNQKRRVDRLSSNRKKSRNGTYVKNGSVGMNASINNKAYAGNGSSPDIDIRKIKSDLASSKKSPFGYSFGLGFLESDFAYEWKFMFHTTPKLALVGSFKHALGTAANSYFLMANWDYLLKDEGDLRPYISGGMGVINTVPERSISIGGVSHMAVNYGLGARKKFKRNTTLNFRASAYTVFVGKGMRHFKEFNVGLIVGKFWD